MLNSNESSRRIDGYVRLLDQLTALQKEIGEVIETKIAAAREANLEKLGEINTAEQTLVARLGEREGLRRSLVGVIGRGFGLNDVTARRLTVEQLATRVGGSDGARLRSAGRRLRDMTVKVQRRNRIARMICQTILRDVKMVFSAMTPEGEAPQAYTRTGFTRGPAACMVLDAVG